MAGQVEIVGTTVLALPGPLVEAARGDETAAGQKRVAEGRARPEPFRAHVDHEAARAGLGDDAPARPGEVAAALRRRCDRRAHGRQWLGGRDVVAGVDLGLLVEAEDLR